MERNEAPTAVLPVGPMALRQEGRGAGRPRDNAIDVAVRRASWELLGTGGYEALTFEAVAEGAGCSRAALYRRFGSKAELVKTLLQEACRLTEPALEPGTMPRRALIAFTRSSADFFAGAQGKALLALFAAQSNVPDLARIIHENTANERAIYATEFRGATGCELSEAVIALMFDMLTGTVMFAGAIQARVLTEAEIEALVDQALLLGCSSLDAD